MNGSITMETAADRALKLPLESAFDPPDHHRHHNHRHHHHRHNHGEDEMVGDDNREQSEGEDQRQPQDQSEQPSQYNQQKLVSLSPPMPPSFISNEASPSTFNDSRSTPGTKNRSAAPATDPSLTAAAAAAVASIQDVWSENFNEPLPTNKEERIQQALEFMRTEKHAHTADKNIKKHSIRQIALFFQVPKSTLYDRLKNKTSSSTDVGDKGKTITNSTASSYAISSRAHSQQMKISMEKEELLLIQTHNLCHALGNTLNLTHIRDFITSLVNGVSLGKKWVHNFTRRHDNTLIYGTLSSRYNVRMLNSKNCRCNFEYLWRCFVPLLQECIANLPQEKPFYYITKTTVHQPSMSSIFTCFEIIPRDMSIELFGKPQIVIFPDYFGKSYLQRDGNPISREMQKQSQMQNDIESSPIINGHSDVDHSSLDNGAALDAHSKITKHEKFQKQYKVDKLNEVFAGIYADCCTKRNADTGSESELMPFVVFEGFNDRYNWDPLACKSLVHLGHFLALPWNQQIFQQSISKQLINVVDNVARSSSILATQLSVMETTLEHTDLDMSMFVADLNRILRMPRESAPTSVENHESVQENELNVFASTLHSPSSHEQEVDNGFLTKNNQHQQPIETVSSANIFENTTLSQLQEVINLIDNNESELYRNLLDPSSKATLMDIFSKIKGILPQ